VLLTLPSMCCGPGCSRELFGVPMRFTLVEETVVVARVSGSLRYPVAAISESQHCLEVQFAVVSSCLFWLACSAPPPRTRTPCGG
jgi:hypothetical protein